MLRVFLAAIGLLLTTSTLVLAQTDGEFLRLDKLKTNTPPYFFHTEDGEPTVQVYVWGTVRNPGLYEVSTGTDLGKLLTLAGGPIGTPRDRNTDRVITVQMHRFSGESRMLVYTATLDAFIAQTSPYPTLQTGDVLTVETVERRRFTWRDGLTVVTATAAVVVAIAQFINITSR